MASVVIFVRILLSSSAHLSAALIDSLAIASKPLPIQLQLSRAISSTGVHAYSTWLWNAPDALPSDQWSLVSLFAFSDRFAEVFQNISPACFHAAPFALIRLKSPVSGMISSS